MAQNSYRQFFHRYNPDNTVDLVCSDCFHTVARRVFLTDLSTCERDHICVTDRVYFAGLANGAGALRGSGEGMAAHRRE